MFKKRAIDRLSGELSASVIHPKEMYKRSAANTGTRIGSPSPHNLDISSDRNHLLAKIKALSQPKIKSHPLPQEPLGKIPSPNDGLKPSELLTITLHTGKQSKTLEFKYNSTTEMKQLTAFLKHQIRQSNVVFEGPSVMMDYMLALQNELVMNLRAKKLSLKTVFLRVQPFVNNPLGNFRILKCIGAGGFSKVFLVEVYGVFMALKVIPKQLLAENDKETIVLSEKNILIEMKRHPFITKIHYAFETSRHVCLALEYCPGGELFYLLKKIKRMKEHQAQFYFLEVLSALKALHEKGIVYRDLKPENIIIDHEGHVRLADFGLSKQLKEDITYSFCGSAEYMAPQMLLKEGHDFTIDYYCIGALLYELVTGLPPYYSRNQQELFNNILLNTLYFPDQKVTLSPAIKSILKGLLHKNPKKRLGSSMGIMEIFAHPWITKLSIPDLLNKKLIPPHKPDLLVYNFDDTEYQKQESELMKQIQEQSRECNVKNLLFPDFYYESKEMQIEMEAVKNAQRRESLNKQKARKSPENTLYIKQSFERIASPKQYAFLKTRSPVRQGIFTKSKEDCQFIRHSSENERNNKQCFNGMIYYRRSVDNQRVLESKNQSVEKRRGYESPFKRDSEERKTTHNSLKYISAYSPKASFRLSSNIQSPRRIEELTRVKSSEILKKGFLQKDKIKSYFNR